ncbi:MAG: ribosome-binding factor A [Candidatus Kaiserbacteria bacterium]|nr:ribosome-binding factor A [Candidatus Kaiserbacteria bacterium]
MNERDIKSGRVTSIVHEGVAKFITETANNSSFITVSYVHLTKSGSSARVYYSVFPEERSEQAADFLRRQEQACKEYLKKHSMLRTVPTIRFVQAKEMPGTG